MLDLEVKEFAGHDAPFDEDTSASPPATAADREPRPALSLSAAPISDQGGLDLYRLMLGRTTLLTAEDEVELATAMREARARLVESLSDGIRKPEGVLAGSEGRVFATGAGSDNLVVLLDGAVRKEIGDLSAPHDVEFAPNRDVWIADAANDRLVRVNQDLGIEMILSGDPYGFSGPRYLDVAPDGTLVVADKYSHSVKVIAESGEVIGVIGTGEPGLGPNVFKTPEGVELRGETVWLSDSGNDRIVKYRLTWD